MDQELVQYLDERFAGVDRHFEEIREEFGGKFEEMRGEMHVGFDEVKRHQKTFVIRSSLWPRGLLPLSKGAIRRIRYGLTNASAKRTP